MTLYASHFLYLRCYRQADILDALNILNLGLFLHFTVAPFLLYFQVMPAFYESLWDWEAFPSALVLIHAFCVMVQVGYYLDIRSRTRKKEPVFTGSPSEWKLIGLLLAVVMIMSFKGLLPMEVATSGIYIGLSSMVFALPYFLLTMLPQRASGVAKCAVFGGIVWSLWISLFSGIGSKAGVANVVLAFVVYRNYMVRRLRLFPLVVGAASTIMVVTYMNYSRAVGYLSNIAWSAANPFSGENIATFWAAGVSSMLTPFEAFMVVLDTFPRTLPYQYGQRFLEEMVYPLFPRIMFPWKPEIYGSGFFWEYHTGFLSLETKIYESVSLPGYFYLDFSIPGIIVGGLLVGVIHRYVYQRLISDGATRGSVCLYGIISGFSLIAARAFFWTSYPIIVSVMIPMILIYLVQRRHGNTLRFPWPQRYGARGVVEVKYPVV
ncbi:MAG: hypothetical protein ACOYXR_04905 [Nitrospirota bacterium]